LTPNRGKAGGKGRAKPVRAWAIPEKVICYRKRDANGVLVGSAETRYYNFRYMDDPGKTHVPIEIRELQPRRRGSKPHEFPMTSDPLREPKE